MSIDDRILEECTREAEAMTDEQLRAHAVGIRFCRARRAPIRQDLVYVVGFALYLERQALRPCAECTLYGFTAACPEAIPAGCVTPRTCS